MSRKFTGFGAMGSATPEMRSAMMNIKRSLRSLAQAQRSQALPNEQEVARAPGLQQQRGFSAGGRATQVIFGNDVDKPNTTFLLARGVGAFVYIAQDVDKMYMWNGVAYKSATFT